MFEKHGRRLNILEACNIAFFALGICCSLIVGILLTVIMHSALYLLVAGVGIIVSTIPFVIWQFVLSFLIEVNKKLYGESSDDTNDINQESDINSEQFEQEKKSDDFYDMN